MRTSLLGALVLVLAALSLVTCSGADKKKDGKAAAGDAGATKGPSALLSDLADGVWAAWMREYPEDATILGIHDHDDKLTDLTDEGRTRRLGQARAFLEQAEKIDAAGLAPQERITRDVLIRELKQQIRAQELDAHLFMSLDQLAGPQAGGFGHLVRKYHPRATVKDVENLIARYKAFGPYMDAYLAILKAGEQKQVTAPGVIVDRVVAQLKEIAAEGPDKSAYATLSLPEGISDEDKKRLGDELKAAAKDVVLPAFAKLQTYLESEYVLAARAAVGIGTIPNGEAIYSWLIERHTTRNLTADELHKMGTDELARIEAEMMTIALSQKHKKGKPLTDFVDKLRKDKKTFPKDKTELLAAYKAALDRARGKVPEAFEALPSVDFEVVEMDAARAVSAPAAYYEEADLEGTRKAQVVINTFKAETRPLFSVEAIAFHEGIPGHHLQVGLAHDQKDLPRIRRVIGFSAFVEGWALYSERLSDELGLYSTPISRFGYLGARAWRAVRLVVDTGLHAKGWDRQKAVDYMKAHSPMAAADIENEVDRYIQWPGQALAYMVGALEIEALRKDAQDKLGDKFDRKAFHAAILKSGAVPLETLKGNVTAYVEALTAPPPVVDAGVAPAAAANADGGAAPASSSAGAPDGGSAAAPAAK